MKRTLIFLSFFLCFVTMFAQTQIVYTDSNGVVTATILKTEVVETIEFTNPTGFWFSNEEKQTLFEDGTIIKNETTLTSLFPPMVSKIETKISLEEGLAFIQDQHQHPAEFDWQHLLFCMVLPFLGIFLAGFFVPREKKFVIRDLSIFYLTTIAGSFAGSVFPQTLATADFASSIFILAVFIFCILVAGLYNRTIAVLVVVTVMLSIGSGMASSSFGTQYVVFTVAACLISFIARQVYLKYKAKKDLQVAA
jgi:hypothetical protein